VETELFIETFSWLFSSLVDIDDLPFLLNRTIIASHVSPSTFCRIACIENIFGLLVDDLFILVGEISPPSSELGVHVVASDNKVSFTSIALHLEYTVAAFENSFSLAVE
jgi:hypothetical protein